MRGFGSAVRVRSGQRAEACGALRLLSLEAESGYFVYRLSALGTKDAEQSVELEYPKARARLLGRFFAATYMH